ncbi:7-carboxy-7-deazaguanine synthase [Methylacidimicrobium cyclopophantes]|uniref:7-carboxy-7-deazaguanine synthase n=1 Tax=Methylacidimicrobium cyclopophantes TaxID=1041766 RepID=A0A5E6MJF0_9BACT|nr:radical SAM protein [Methylacidimicrobium cyclopophantes]VVM08085.1 7-carboxy-7-deazaguanine synthase [Methylacidimicrobium cyclopophantes]
MTRTVDPSPSDAARREPAVVVNEIFWSIQGESTFAGEPCVFVRLTGCDLRCRWCDTQYAFFEGERMPLSRLLREVERFGCGLVELTGGEPLLQRNSRLLLQQLCDAGYTVLLETSGAHSIDGVDPRVHRIVDCKCPSSGESARNLSANLDLLGPRDELKFVIGTEADYQWARKRIDAASWAKRVRAIHFSPVFGELSLETLAGWILRDRLPVRLGFQLHKFIWDPNLRGV